MISGGISVKKQLIIICASAGIALIIMSGGYCIWTKELTIKGKVIVEKGPKDAVSDAVYESDDKKSKQKEKKAVSDEVYNIDKVIKIQQ